MTALGAANTANLGAGLASSFAGFQQLRAARSGMKSQARFIEQVAEQEAEAILRAGDDQLRAFSARHAEILDEEALNRFTGEQRAREARDTGEAMIAQIQARSASRGVVISEGSPLELAAQAAFEAEHKAAVEEIQTRLISKNLLTRAKQEMQSGQAARFAAQMQARSTILTAKAQATGIRMQAPSTGDILMSLTRPLTQLDADKLEAGTETVRGLFRRKTPSSKTSLLNPTPETLSEPAIRL